MSIDRLYLHNKIQRSKKYSGWASDLGLARKSGTTTLGNEYEQWVADKLASDGYSLERMTNGHPYDLLVNKTVKIDVKVANIYHDSHGCKVHTFNLAKNNPTCDIYVLIALNEVGKVAKELVIPSKFLNQKVVAMGIESVYDVYHNRYDFVKQYADFYGEVAV